MKAHALRNADGSFELWLDEETTAVSSAIGLTMLLSTLYIEKKIEPIDLIEILQRIAQQMHEDANLEHASATDLAELLDDARTLNRALGRAVESFRLCEEHERRVGRSPLARAIRS